MLDLDTYARSRLIENCQVVKEITLKSFSIDLNLGRDTEQEIDKGNACYKILVRVACMRCPQTHRSSNRKPPNFAGGSQK